MAIVPSSSCRLGISILAASLPILLASCSGQHDETVDSSSGERAPWDASVGRTLKEHETAEARTRLDQLRATFRTLQPKAADPSLSDLLAAPVPSTPRSTLLPVLGVSHLKAISALPSGRAVAFVDDEATPMSARQQARVELPKTAGGAVLIEDIASKIAIEFHLRGAKSAELEAVDGFALYRAAAEDDADLVLRVHFEGAEDYVAYTTRPAREQVSYAVDVSRVAGLHLIDGLVEFLDGQGTPRLRMEPPRVLDAKGVWHDARVSLSGCAYDADRRTPWGRAVVPPGSRTCDITVSWEGAGVQYPALVDPSWSTTGSMVTARANHAATRLANGKVLVTGGFIDFTGVGLQTAELWDPATGAWSSAGTMAQRHGYHPAPLLSDGRVLVSEGRQSFTSPSTYVMTNVNEIYVPATNTWVAGPTGVTPRHHHSATLLKNNKVLICGGRTTPDTYLSSCELTDAAVTTLAATASMYSIRSGHVAVKTPAGNVWSSEYVMMIGGRDGSSSYQTNTEHYMVDSGTWSGNQPMGHPRDSHTAVLTYYTGSSCIWAMPCAHIFVAGGLGPGGAPVSEVERFDVPTASWSHLDDLLVTRTSPATAVLELAGDERVLITGGNLGSVAQASSEIFWRTGTPHIALPNFSVKRYVHTATSLADGRVLIAGGKDVLTELRSAEVFSLLAQGTACSAVSECRSGYCVDGVCCDQACTGTCQACSGAKKGSGADGTCGLVVAGVDPDNDCQQDVAASCQHSGACDGLGGCELWASGTVCGADSCANGFQIQPRCNGYGTCSAPNVSCAPFFGCGATACLTQCTTYDDCAANAWCNDNTKLCEADRPLGGPCYSAAQCASGNCSGNICCDTACQGDCQSCWAVYTGGAQDGICRSIKAGTDPKGLCTAEAQDTCGLDGSCNGAGACSYYATGLSCGSPTCADGARNAYSCNGLGHCSTSATYCAPYVCSGAAPNQLCRASCATDADCVAAYWCRTSDGTCQPDQAKGLGCAAASQCSSGNCADGVCCDTACAGPCETCLASKGTGPDGACSAVAAGTDPDSECSAQNASTCGTDGSCSGNRSCKYFAAGTGCGTTTCAGGNQTGLSCNGLGLCGSATTPCAPYVCAGSQCAATCSKDDDCIPSYWCDVPTHTCQPDAVAGIACLRPSQCSSGNCVDTFCCDTACAGTCQACSNAKKGSGNNGTCSTISNGADPDSECPDPSGPSCGYTGACSGTGTCALQVAGIACGVTNCTTGVQTGFACNGLGNCLSATTAACAPYLCGTTSCRATCATDADCIPGAWCQTSDHTCQLDQPKGSPCTSFSQCATGNCADSLCCDTACAGACQACSAARKGTGVSGDCGNVKAGTDPDNECDEQLPSTCGTTGFCSGVAACALYSSGTPCGSTKCSTGTQVGQACSGSGQCLDASTTACSPYVCGGTQCAATCNDDSQCVSLYYCRISDHSCQPDQANGGACTGASQCLSTNCVDGFCCDTACQGACQACSFLKKSVGSDGVCGSIAAGADPDNECADAIPSSCSTNGFCSGSGACAFYASGTACGSTSCSGGVQVGHSCNGSGTCLDAATSACAPYLCFGNACATSCVQDSDCIASYWCSESDHSCQPDQDNSKPCSGPDECKSGYCVDGNCCDSACDGLCQACSASKKGGGVDGSCGAIAGGADPDNDCTDLGPASCATNGACSGAGTCSLYPAGIACGTTVCSAGIQSGQTCNGAGTCIPAATAACTPFECVGSVCATACNDDSSCISAYYCKVADHACQPDLPDAAPCTAGSQCANGHCVDGLCCDTTCEGSCMACSAAKKGSGTDGACGPVVGGTDPDGDCDDQGEASCGRNGACAGDGSCRLYGVGAPCGTSACVGNAVKGDVCNGLGTCVNDPSGVDCSPHVCNANGCANPCATDQHCLNGFHCSQGTCVAKAETGQSCADATECKSGFCADHVCCSGVCDRVCETCNQPGNAGVCVPVTGAPVAPRPSCGGSGTCAGTCDGTNAAECAFPGSAVICSTSCAGGGTTTSTCDAAGHCVPGPALACAPYACDQDAKACKTSCVTKSDCVPGLECSAGACQGAQPAADGGTGGSSGSGGSGGVGGQDQDASNPPAEPAPTASDNVGCGCRTSSSNTPAHTAAGLFLLGLVLAARRCLAKNRVTLG